MLKKVHKICDTEKRDPSIVKATLTKYSIEIMHKKVRHQKVWLFQNQNRLNNIFIDILHKKVRCQKV